MSDDKESSCQKCPIEEVCQTSGEPSDERLVGWALAIRAGLCFLVPLVAAIIAAAVAGGATAGLIAGVIAFVVSAAVMAVVGRALRRRR